MRVENYTQMKQMMKLSNGKISELVESPCYAWQFLMPYYLLRVYTMRLTGLVNAICCNFSPVIYDAY